MISNNCLICENECKNYKQWNQHKILICKNCTFSYIHSTKSQVEDVFSPSEKSFIDKSIENDKARSNLFAEKIVKNRIKVYEKILKKKPLNILEVGCGTAVSSYGYLKNNINYTGIELDRNLYNFAMNKSRNVLYGDFLETNFDEKFDIIFASQVVEHIDKPNNFFKKCNEILEKNGILHIDVPNDFSMVSFVRKIFKNKKYYGAIRPPYHMRAYSPKSISKLFSRNHFYNIKVFSKINWDRTFGQLVENVSLQRAVLFRLQQLSGMNSLLIGLAQKK